LYISVKTFTNEYDVEIEWDLTTRCNYSCSYCKSYDNTKPLSVKTLPEYEEAIDYLISYFPKKRIKIDFLGGEPMLFKEWPELLDKVYIKGHIPKIITNLAIPLKTLKNKLRDKNFKECIDVSFHPEFADPNSFIDKVNFLYDNGFLKTGGVLMHPDYWDICTNVFDKLQHTGKIGYSKIKNEDTNSNSIASGFIEYNEEQEKLLSKPSTVVTGRFTQVTYSDRVESYKNIDDLFANGITNFKGLSCYVGKSRLHIKPGGDCYPSACLMKFTKSRMGNVYKQDLKHIKNPIICPFNFCGCGPDMRIEKKAI
jgi:MoaA/NifB/PqqE/SkfB family radical SAM enzyme